MDKHSGLTMGDGPYYAEKASSVDRFKAVALKACIGKNVNWLKRIEEF
jgi:hypothetical protein